MDKEIILITGSSGQLGTVLAEKLQEKYGVKNIIATDLRVNPTFNGVFETLDVTDFDAIEAIVLKYKITQIYHLAAILSANGEKHPLSTWDLNMKTLFNVLEVSRIHKISKVFFPSSIAVFGNNVERLNTPQSSNLTPSTVYGISKAAGENWGKYYFDKYGLDVRSLRYPGVIGYQSLPGGGTTDYAVDIFHKAVKNENYECFLNADTTLPMIYMDDAIRATLELMEAPKDKITVRTSYNISGLSFNPNQLETCIKENYTDFKVTYSPDFRQGIANSWPMSIDDLEARKDWQWKPKFDIKSLTKVMLKNLELKYNNNLINS
ncbi:NAD-dependent epimerase [Polaribacter sejongensis]|uniref:NAD-dependent epimerase n=1 Tax=Polaribacter sejongensis TaxID=985043 RepID=A0AAJ1QU54_9FLAO|nr:MULTISPECIES: NAD-dependent epimerase/dehydratase family protein [Polaribacter]AUC23715.1 NAD-dependent epimerase [Polaribacter sejongensis]MDN3617898.1 NAD-dependent epimerase/dehydratase family protein [Polaribacter undariae]UWD32070.1 NAD-dependent epimerase/dehydratase family protein [Polaribacter undariae]